MPIGAGALIATAAISGGSAVASGLIQSHAAKSAAKTQAAAADRALALEQRTAKEAQARLEPYQQAGQLAGNGLVNFLQTGGRQGINGQPFAAYAGPGADRLPPPPAVTGTPVPNPFTFTPPGTLTAGRDAFAADQLARYARGF